MENNEEIKEKELEIKNKSDTADFQFGFSREDKPKKEKKIKTKLIKNNDSQNKHKNKSIILSILITFVVCLSLSILMFNFYFKEKTGEVTKVIKDVTVTETGIADAVEKVYDAVVVVEVYSNGQLYSTGTGFVFKTDENYGYILTNSHVISSGDEVHVIFTNNTNEKVEVIGSDNYSDIAVLSVAKDKVISVAKTSESDDIRVGDTTFAVGAPLSSQTYSWTVTRGILSGKNRTVEVASTNGTSTNVLQVLQTDTAINSGNSGGPLCNSNGEVIGITNMKIAASSVEGMGFAIPIKTAIEYANKFINNESISRPYIGISMYDLSSNMFSNAKGIYIDGVESNSPAEKAGLQKGDIIVKIGDVSVETSSYFKYELYKYKVGEKVKITVKRNNEEKEVTVTLGTTSISS